MKPQYDVNDNGHSTYNDPDKKYKGLDNTGNSNPTIVKRNRYAIKSTIHLILLIGIFFLLIFILAFCVNLVSGKKIDENKFYSTNETFISTYGLDMKITNCEINENNEYNITLEIANNAMENAYLSAKGIYLTSDKNVYCVSSIETNESAQFYGKAIEPSQKITAVLTFENIKDEPNSLVVSNINDTKHQTWTNSLTIEKH